jgi:hypothetical protein
MRRASWLMALIVGCSAAWAVSAQDIGWQEAVARLAQERTLAETCIALLKKYGNAGAIERGQLAYADAKAEYDAIIAGLDVALAQSDQPAGPGGSAAARLRQAAGVLRKRRTARAAAAQGREKPLHRHRRRRGRAAGRRAQSNLAAHARR